MSRPQFRKRNLMPFDPQNLLPRYDPQTGDSRAPSASAPAFARWFRDHPEAGPKAYGLKALIGLPEAMDAAGDPVPDGLRELVRRITDRQERRQARLHTR